MKIDMLMPQMGESITTANISRWLKAVGDSVEKDEIILEITTDKVDSEIPSPASGVVTELLYSEGDEVPVKSKIAIIDSSAEKAEVAPKPAAAEQSADSGAVNVADTPAADTQEQGAKIYSPLVKNLAKQNNISTEQMSAIDGSGKGGRVTKDDFNKFLEQRDSAPHAEDKQSGTPEKSANPPAAAAAKPAQSPSSGKQPAAFNEWLADGTKHEPMNGMRRAIAHHMVKSKQTSPHVYTVQEADVTNVATWRAANKSEFKKREGFNLSFTPFFLEAAVKALQEFPIVNASLQDQTIVYKRDVNLGCAVSLGKTGLIVPVIKKSGEKNLIGIARGLNDIAGRARDKKLIPDDVAGGTFTVTNPGIFGTMIGTPIINQPQSAILCLGAIEKRPVVIKDMIAIRQRCYLTLSYDHRIIDGSTSAQFLAYICDYLSNWELEKSLF